MKMFYRFWGKVIGGQKRGRILGYPTANVRLHKKIPEGIYATEVIVHDVSARKTSPRPSPKRRGIIRKYVAATFIGSAKTFGEREYKAESFILDFDQNIYGKWITVQLHKKIRGNIKFSSEKELINQMNDDIEQVRAYFSAK